MPVENWLAFAAASTFILLAPGPTILTVISYALTHGKRANSLLVLAVVLGDATAIVVSVAGLGALLVTSAFWFSIVKLIGGLYLLCLGIAMMVSRNRKMSVDAEREPVLYRSLFLHTYLVTAMNPKGIIFFIAFLPQFVSSEANQATQLWILALTFVVLASLNTALYAAFASSARRLIVTSNTHNRFRVIGGGVLAGAGIWTMMAKQPT